MKKLFTIIAAVTLLLSASAKAQKSVSISARYGINTMGLSATIYLPYAGAIENLFTTSHDRNRVLLTSMYETMVPLGQKHNFVLYAGAGLHAGYKKTFKTVQSVILKYDEVNVPQTEIITNRSFITGADAILGINYNIPYSRFYAGVDLKPNTDFINAHSMMVDGGVRIGVSF